MQRPQTDHDAQRARLNDVLRECDLTYSELAKELSKAGQGHVPTSDIYFLLFRNSVLAAPFRNHLLDLGFPADALPPEAAATT